MKEQELQQTTKPHTKWLGEILGHKPRLNDQFSRLFNEIREIDRFLDNFTPDLVNEEKINKDQKTYLGEKLTAIIVISSGLLEHLECNFKQLFDEYMRRITEQYKTDEVRALIQDYQISAEEAIARITYFDDEEKAREQ